MPTDNKQISDLTSASTLDGTELFLITQGGNSRKVDLTTLANWIKTASSIVPSSNPWRGARASRSTTLSSLTSPVIITWEATAIDTDSFWSAAAPTRLTIPTGVTKVRLDWYLKCEPLAAAGSVAGLLFKNGSVATGNDHYGYTSNREGTSGFTDNPAMGFSSVLSVSAGDYFELQYNFTMSGQDQIQVGSFFEIEVLEATP